jgi:hypothetical protein
MNGRQAGREEGRWIQDLNYTFKVIVVCVLNCKLSQAMKDIHSPEK